MVRAKEITAKTLENTHKALGENAHYALEGAKRGPVQNVLQLLFLFVLFCMVILIALFFWLRLDKVCALLDYP